MLERPQLHDEKIIACLQEKYGLFAVQLLFLPLGADLNTFVYRIVAQDEKYYFLKLRSGDFNESSLKLTDILSGLGVRQIIPPFANQKREPLGKPGSVQGNSLPLYRGEKWF